MAEWRMEWQNGRIADRNGGMEDGMAEWGNGGWNGRMADGMAEWRNGGWNGGMVEWSNGGNGQMARMAGMAVMAERQKEWQNDKMAEVVTYVLFMVHADTMAEWHVEIQNACTYVLASSSTRAI
jgi:hypothetical protein